MTEPMFAENYSRDTFTIAKGLRAAGYATGNNAFFKADEIEAYHASPSSLMPSGLSETMSVNEFRDLVAFLNSLKQ